MSTRYAPHGAAFWTSSNLRGRSIADTRLGRFFRWGASTTPPQNDDASSQGSLVRHTSSSDSLIRGSIHIHVEESAVYAAGRRKALKKWLGVGERKHIRGRSHDDDDDDEGREEGNHDDNSNSNNNMEFENDIEGNHHDNKHDGHSQIRPRRRWRFREYGLYTGLFRVMFLFVFVFVWLWKWIRRWNSSIRRNKIARRNHLITGLREAFDYTEWYYIASELDSLEGNTYWKIRKRSRYSNSAPEEESFEMESEEELGKHTRDIATERIASVCDLGMLKGRLRELSQLFRRRDFRKLMFALRGNLVRNLAGMCHPELHTYSRVGTKRIVEDYVNVVSHLLKCIANAPTRSQTSCSNEERPLQTPRLTVEEKLVFFNEARHAYGRTALMLSGGATLGINHFGVVKALLNQNLLPKVVCGTSAGALVGSYVGIFKDVELRSILESERMINPLTNQPFSFTHIDKASFSLRLRRFFTKGYIADVRILQDCLRKNYGDLTFEEAYVRTKRILNITVCSVRSSSDPPLLLNYLTAPHVLIWSAVAASCALPIVFAPVELVAKDVNGNLVSYQPDGIRWIDGSITSDIPLSRIGELFNVNHFIVSQTNPHIIPRGSAILQTRLARLVKAEIQFRYWQLLQLRMVPRIISSIFPHFVQPYEGDVTIMPDVTVRDLLRLLKNPTPDDVRDCIRRGEKQTFPKIDRIRLHCLIERTLEAAIESLAETMNMQGPVSPESTETNVMSRFAGRVPSWLWLDSGSSLGADKKQPR